MNSYEKVEEISNKFYEITREVKEDKNDNEATELINNYTNELLNMIKTEKDKKDVIKFLVQKIYLNHLFDF